MISCFLGKRGNRRKEMDKEEKMEQREVVERDGREGTYGKRGNGKKI